MRITKYDPSDREQIRAICLATCNDPFLLEHTGVLYALYCDCYLDSFADSCFAVKSEQRTVGYILCAADGAEYLRLWRRELLPSLRCLSLRAAREKRPALLADRLFVAAGYSAHLHIDLLPCAQGQGMGTQLIAALEAHLVLKGVKGLYLCCGADNAAARRFYEKNGFRLRAVLGSGCFYTKKLRVG